MADRMKDVTPPRADFEVERPLAISAQAKALSQALRKMAVRARGRNRFQFQNYGPTRRWENSFNYFVIGAFLALVVIPVFVSGVYLAIFMTDQYASETRFAVRGAERVSFDPIASLTGVPSTQRIQEASIISDYVRGRGIVEELEKTIKLREKLSGSQIDLVSRFRADAPIEDLVRYWRWHVVDVNIDALSGIINVWVYAFTPQDALDISKAILNLSEKLVNDLSERSRVDALRQTQGELTRAEEALQNKNREMRTLRNAEGLLDAEKTSDVMTQMLADMRLDVIRMDREYNAQRQSVATDSPQLRVLESRIKATREQIQQLENQMTGTSRKNAPALSESMSRFERVKFDHDLAEKRYVAAAASFERARVDLTTQQIYLTTFIPPTLAQKSLYPRRLWIFTIIVVGSLAIWGLLVGAAVLIRNHMA